METAEVKMFTDTIRYDEKEMIWVKPLCDFFQIDTKYQYQRIKNDAVLGKLVGKNRPDLGRIDDNGRIFLTQKGFLRWVQTINANTINDQLRDMFILYQSLIFDFFHGSAEERAHISRVNKEIQEWKQVYSEAGNMVRKKQSELTELLNHRYQYRLDFSINAELPEIFNNNQE